MPKPLIARPELSDDKRRELKLYLAEMWRRAEQGRQGQVDSDYARWAKLYDGTPLERERTVPFYKSSNLVVKLVRIYVDTFAARTLNIIFATDPLYTVTGLTTNLKDAWQLYLNRKALQNWNHYNVAKQMIDRGARNGSVVLKTVYNEEMGYNMVADTKDAAKETSYTIFSGPETTVIPFEDFYVYPSTAEAGCADSTPWRDTIIKFHRVRYAEEKAKEMMDKDIWQVEKKDVESYLTKPRDIKQMQTQDEANVNDPQFMEMTVIECHLRYAVTNDNSRMYDIVGVLHPTSGELLDVYFSPYIQNIPIFTDYRPYQREGLWYGESMCELLATCQEEASAIHNDRRNNSFIANAVCFKRKNGSLLPNPSTNWYPGKVWDLESMDDLDVFTVGRNYENMLQQEDYTFNLADQLSGIGEQMRGTAAGQQGTRGVYNSMGTLSVMAEGNQRQDTNIRDVRSSLSQLGRVASRLQASYGPNDPMIATLPKDIQPLVREAMAQIAADKLGSISHLVGTSAAGANSETRKASLLQMSQVVSQYSGFIQQMLPQLLSPQINPGMRAILNDIMNMQAAMARELMREFDLSDMVEDLPNVAAGIEKAIPGGSAGTRPPEGGGNQGGMDPGGAGSSIPPVSRQLLAGAAALPQQAASALGK